MPSSSQTFIATEDELQLAEKLLEINNWKRSDSLSVDTALGIFKQTGLSFKQLREIWTIADKNGAGSLSRDELTVAIRLMGWVQSGAHLSEGLLAQQGPLPHIKGLTNFTIKKDELPNITATDVVGFQAAFIQLGAINGRLDRERVKQVYMQSETSMDQVEQIMSHLSADTHETVGFNDFALGMHLIQTLKSDLISSVPSQISPEVYKILALHKIQEAESALPLTWQTSSLPPPPPSALPRNNSSLLPWAKADSSLPRLPAEAEADLQRYMEMIERVGAIPGDMVVDLELKYRIRSAEVATIWNRSHTAANVWLTSEELISIRSLLHKLIADKTTHQRPRAPSPDHPPTMGSNVPTAAEEKKLLRAMYESREGHDVVPSVPTTTVDADLPAIRRETPKLDTTENMTRPQPPFRTAEEEKRALYEAARRAVLPQNSVQVEVDYEPSAHFSSPSPRSDPPAYFAYSPSILQRTPSPLPRATQTSRSIRQDDVGGLREEILRLTSRLEQTDIERVAFRDDLRQTNEALRKEVDQFKLRERSLESALEEKDEEASELRKSVSSLQWDVLEHQVLLREKEEALANVTHEAHELRQTVDIQDKQIVGLKDLATDMGKAIADAPSKPDNTDLRVLFLRASLRDAQAAAAKAEQEVDEFRKKSEAQSQQIIGLQQRLADTEANNELSVLRREMKEGKEVIKAQMQEMQDAFQRALLSTGSQGRSNKSSEMPGAAQRDLSEESRTISHSEPGSPSWFHSSSSTPVPQINVDDLSFSSSSRREVDIDIVQLESDLQLFKRDVERKGFIGPEVIERFISEYDIEAADLDEIGLLADANDDNRLSSDEIDAAMVLIRKKLTSPSRELPSLSLTSSEYDDEPEITWSSTLTGRSSSLATPLPNPFSPAPPKEADDDIYVSLPDAPVLLKRSYHPNKTRDNIPTAVTYARRPVTLQDDPGQRYLFS